MLKTLAIVPVISSTLWMVASSATGGLFLVLLLIAGVVVPVRVSSVHRVLDARPAAPVAESASDKRNLPGAVIGAIIGGVLGHQVGAGTGRDIATAGGAVVGSRVGNDGSRVSTQDVQRCKTVPSTRATDFWDVAYTFRGKQHNIQLSSPRGRRSRSTATASRVSGSAPRSDRSDRPLATFPA